MNTVRDIKAGDIIYSPIESWLIFVTEDMKLVWLSTTTSRFEPIHLGSVLQDVGKLREVTHLNSSKFFILGNIKEMIKLSDEAIKDD